MGQHASKRNPARKWSFWRASWQEWLLVVWFLLFFPTPFFNLMLAGLLPPIYFPLMTLMTIVRPDPLNPPGVENLLILLFSLSFIVSVLLHYTLVRILFLVIANRYVLALIFAPLILSLWVRTYWCGNAGGNFRGLTWLELLGPFVRWGLGHL